MDKNRATIHALGGRNLRDFVDYAYQRDRGELRGTQGRLIPLGLVCKTYRLCQKAVA